MARKSKHGISLAIVIDLAKAFGKTTETINAWINLKDDRLTSDKAKNVFIEHGFEYKPEPANA